MAQPDLPNKLIRGTNWTIVQCGPWTWYFSYNTLVAFSNVRKGWQFRTNERFGHTTSRHMMQMEVFTWPSLDPDRFAWTAQPA